MNNKPDNFLFVPDFNQKPDGGDSRAELQSRPDLVQTYLKAKESFIEKNDVVYNPGCGNDISPSEAFPDSRVIYAELDKPSVEALKEKGYEAHLVDAHTFDPGPVDVLIMINPGMSAEVPVSFVQKGGVVICNNYHATADQIHAIEDFECVGVVTQTSKNTESIDTENINHYFEELDNEEDLKQKPRDFNFDNHRTIERIVHNKFGNTDDLLKKYHQLIEDAKRQEILEGRPINDDTIFNLGFDGDMPMILKGVLPRKKGFADSVFIFKKKK